MPVRSNVVRALVAAIVLTALGAIGITRWAQGATPELILHGGRVYTVVPSMPWAEAVAITGGLITAVGTDAEILATAGPNTTITDLGGGMLLPGFQDSHVHALEAGINATLCYFPSNRTARVYEQIARDCAAEQADREWVLGAGVFVGEPLRGPEDPRGVLDRAVPDRPVLVIDDLGHGAWANSRALAAAGYAAGGPDPQGGVVEQRGNRLTGVVFENAQQKLRDAAWPSSKANRQQYHDAIVSSGAEFNRNGITTISDAGGYWTRGHRKAWRRAAKRGDLTVRAHNALYVYPDRAVGAQVRKLRKMLDTDGSDLLRFDQVKIYVDGILDLGTSSLIDPYLRSPGSPSPTPNGFEYFEPAEFQQLVADLSAAGFGVHFHATGDRAVRRALDAVQAAPRRSSGNAAHRITHLYLVDQADRERFATLGVYADLQLSASAIGNSYARYLERFLGRARVDDLLPAAELLAANAPAVLSSDWDADELSPVGTIARAVTRGGGDAIELAAAIRMLTLAPAQLLGHADMTGTIETGKYADLVVLDRDLFAIAPSQISQTQVLLTLLAGDEVYRRDGF